MKKHKREPTTQQEVNLRSLLNDSKSNQHFSERCEKRHQFDCCLFFRQPVSRRPARGDSHLRMESGGRGPASGQRLSLSDSNIPQCSKHTARHCLRTDWTNSHLQERVSRPQECAGELVDWLPNQLEKFNVSNRLEMILPMNSVINMQHFVIY